MDTEAFFAPDEYLTELDALTDVSVSWHDERLEMAARARPV